MGKSIGIGPESRGEEQEMKKAFMGWEFLGRAAAVFCLLLFTGCQPPAPVDTAENISDPNLVFPGSLMETPPPAKGWRGHQLSVCPGESEVPIQVDRLLGTCAELFRDGSGSDGMVELEMALEDGVRHPLIDMTLGQLYLLAGQGEPALLPNEGPAADVGDWTRNKERLLARARFLLERTEEKRSEDGVVKYLLGDVVRAEGDEILAAQYVAQGRNKCIEQRSLTILRFYQQLNRYPAKYLGGASPQYPVSAMEKGISGDVTIDLLLNPDARIRQAVEVVSPSRTLTIAAFNALQQGQFTAARVGKYPVWSWLRVTIAFNLDS